MVPGAPTPLVKVCIGGDNLLLLYGDDCTRLWDVKTLEFRRSMNIEKAKELLNQGSWTVLSVLVYTVVVCATFSLPWVGRYKTCLLQGAVHPLCLPRQLTPVRLKLFHSYSGKLMRSHGSFDDLGGSRIVPLTCRIYCEIDGRR